MDLKEIVSRPNEQVVDHNEMIFVIKEYIKTRKGVSVNPKVESRSGYNFTYRECQLMMHMYNCAVGWFRTELN